MPSGSFSAGSSHTDTTSRHSTGSSADQPQFKAKKPWWKVWEKGGRQTVLTKPLSSSSGFIFGGIGKFFGGIAKGIKGVIAHEDDEIPEEDVYFSNDLDEYPIVDRTLVDYTRYYDVMGEGGIFSSIVRSRGCPYRCTFCNTHIVIPARISEYVKRERD